MALALLVPMTGAQRFAWLVMFTASAMTIIHQSAGFYLAIDFMAFVLLFRGSAWQEAIAACFLAMALLDFVGAYVALPIAYQAFMVSLGWLQLGLLLAWSLPKPQALKGT